MHKSTPPSRALSRRYVRTNDRALRHAVTSIEGLEARQLLASVSPKLVVDQAGELTIDSYLPATHSLYTEGKTLTSARNATMQSIAVDFLQSHAADFALVASDVAAPIVTNHYADDLTGISHVYLQQSVNGLPVMNADMVVNLMPDGSVISAAGGFVPNVQRLSQNNVSPKTSASAALTVASQQLSLSAAAPAMTTRSTSKALARRTVIDAPTVSQDSIDAQLRYVPTDDGLELAWNFALRTTDDDHWYDVAVGDSRKQIVFANDWTDNASYNVIPRPNDSPDDGGFAVVTDPQDPVASPFGWHDTNGISGPEFTDTRGNNVDAHLDRVNDNVPDGTRPDGGPDLNFTGLLFNSATAPTTAVNQAIAQENLFYYNNLIHDIHYKYGFTEAAGNFQVNNYGRGGIAGDAVQADAQDGGGTNNANFSTPPDGFSGRMQMYLFTSTSPQRDGDLESNIMIHEYGHGVSNRLTGGAANSDALNALQSGGMGEGWGDWWGMMFTQRASDTQNTSQFIGPYSTGSSAGFRRFPYSYNMAVNPLTVDAYGGSGSGGGTTRSLEVHNTGEIWAQTLWDMNWNLVNKYGFEPNIQNGFNAGAIKGNTLALQLVMDALKLQPANPSFKDARDAILQADANLHATLGTPSNAAEIWAAFARRGMGTGFVDAGAGADSVTPSFTVPVLDPTVTSLLQATTFAPFNAIDVRFDQPMNTSSFSIAADVLSFNSPNGANLLGSITGFSWTDSTTLHITLSATQTVRGSYPLVIGPNILAADDGHAMDSDRDGTPGEAVQDRFTGNVVLAASIGPDSFGYKTAAYPFENIDLVAGAPGVVTLTNGSDDASSAINIGANTFNFYGTTYSTTSIFAGVNGLITINGANTSFSNNGLVNQAPSFPSIAPYWADWRTDINGTGGGDSALLYQIDTANNRLIIEWNEVASYYGTGAATFQAILQLNTGATPGRILYNYVDVDINGRGSFGGVGTTGIKSALNPGTNRLLLNLNNVHPWINNGLAVETAIDTTAPTVTSEAYNFATNQSVSMTFSEDVGATLALPDFTLTNTKTNTVVNNANLSYAYNAGTRTATITNTGPTLADGDYVLSLNSAGVTDPSGNPIDGDNDGAIGGNHTLNFFVLGADATRDRKVDFNDLVILAQNYNQTGRTFGQGNFDYSVDGKVDFNDLVILAQHYNVSLLELQALIAGPVLASAPTAASTTLGEGKRTARAILE